MSQIVFIQKNGARHVCDFIAGETILKVAQRHSIDIEGACGGALACSTCHIIVDDKWYSLLPKPLIEERDMLDLASGVTKYSRLGCQIKLTDELSGITVKLP